MASLNAVFEAIAMDDLEKLLRQSCEKGDFCTKKCSTDSSVCGDYDQKND